MASLSGSRTRSRASKNAVSDLNNLVERTPRREMDDDSVDAGVVASKQTYLLDRPSSLLRRTRGQSGSRGSLLVRGAIFAPGRGRERPHLAGRRTGMSPGTRFLSWAATTFAGLMLLAACDTGFVRDEPPPVTVRFLDRSFVLNAWSYCYGNTCADGYPPAPPPDVGDPEEVYVEFPLPEWSFIATFVPADEKCVRAQRVQLDASGEGSFVLKPVGQADTYDVTLFGKGDGDLVVTFRWTTPRHGPPGDLRSVSQPCQRGTS